MMSLQRTYRMHFNKIEDPPVVKNYPRTHRWLSKIIHARARLPRAPGKELLHPLLEEVAPALRRAAHPRRGAQAAAGPDPRPRGRCDAGGAPHPAGRGARETGGDASATFSVDISFANRRVGVSGLLRREGSDGVRSDTTARAPNRPHSDSERHSELNIAEDAGTACACSAWDGSLLATASFGPKR
jgi:hypothetical protein